VPQSTILVISQPAESNLKLLERLPADTRIVAGNVLEGFLGAAPEADVILHCVTPGLSLRDVFLIAPKVKWVHTMAAGIEGILFPELIASPVPLTNGRGVFKLSLAEFAIAAMLFFAKDLRRLVHSQEAGVWDQADVDELRGATLGVVGFGEIGSRTARLAKAFGMRVMALRRRPELSSGDELVDRAFGPAELQTMLSACDYVLVSSPLTPETRGVIGEAELHAMKPTAVLINVGRGPVVREAALVAALEERRIRGAALDVFDVEPLPAGHPFYRLDNVLLSPHCADHTRTWRNDAMEFFLENFERYRKGEPLLNVVDKQSGY